MPPLTRAILQGVAEGGSRAWYGIPGLKPSHTLPDLAKAEAVYANHKAGRFLLQGLRGDVTIALPVTGPEAKDADAAIVSLRLPAAGMPKPDSEEWKRRAALPLILFMGAIPTLDHEDRRPSYPHFALPVFLAAELRLAGFDADERFQVAVVESPGRLKNTRRGLLALLKELPKVFPFDPKRLVLVGDGHGAGCITDLALAVKDRVRGVVVINAHGGLAALQLRRLGDVKVLGIGGDSDQARRSLGLLRTYAKYAEKAVDVRILKLPWSLTLPLSAGEIELFARAVTK